MQRKKLTDDINELKRLGENLNKLKNLVDEINLDTIANKVSKQIEVNERFSQIHWFATQISVEKDLLAKYNLVTSAFSQITGIEECMLIMYERGVGFKAVTPDSIANNFLKCDAFEEIAKKMNNERVYNFGKICSLYESTNIYDKKFKNKYIKVYNFYQEDGYLLGFMILMSDEEIVTTHEEEKFIEIFTLQMGLSLAQAILREKLANYAFTDSLTSLANKRALINGLESEIERVKRSKNSKGFCFIMFDVDNFKHYNDTYGHSAGDVVLRKIGQIIKSNIRKVDIGARYGGEEICVVSTETTLSDGLVVAEKLRKAIEAEEFEYRDVTVSVGVAHYPTNCNGGPVEIMTEADKYLYKAKNSGKNKVCSPFDDVSGVENNSDKESADWFLDNEELSNIDVVIESDNNVSAVIEFDYGEDYEDYSSIVVNKDVDSFSLSENSYGEDEVFEIGSNASEYHIEFTDDEDDLV